MVCGTHHIKIQQWVWMPALLSNSHLSHRGCASFQFLRTASFSATPGVCEHPEHTLWWVWGYPRPPRPSQHQITQLWVLDMSVQHTMGKFQSPDVPFWAVGLSQCLIVPRKGDNQRIVLASISVFWVSLAHSEELLSFACHHTTITHLTHPWQPTHFPFTNSCPE